MQKIICVENALKKAEYSVDFRQNVYIIGG